MESISHAESAAGLSDWKASGLLLLLVDFFSYYLFTPGFEIFSLFKRGNRFVEGCSAELFAGMCQGGEGLDPPTFWGLWRGCAQPFCPLGLAAFHVGTQTHAHGPGSSSP